MQIISGSFRGLSELLRIDIKSGSIEVSSIKRTCNVFAFLEIPEGIIYALTPFCAIILVEAHIGQYGGCATSSGTFSTDFTRKFVSVAQSALDQTFLNIDDVSDWFISPG